MRLLIVSSLYRTTPSDGVGSIENFVHHMANYLVTQGGLDVCVVTKTASTGGLYKQAHANYETLESVVLHIIAQFKPDMIHFHIDSSSLFARLATFSIPVIFTIHDGTLHSNSTWIKDIPNSGVNYIYTVVSHSVKKSLASLLYSEGFIFDSSKILELSVGIDTSKFSESISKPIYKDSYLFMGLIRSYRSVFELVNLFGKLLEKKFTIAGPIKQDAYGELVSIEISKYNNIKYVGEVVGLQNKLDLFQHSIALINAAGYSTLYPNAFEAFGVTMLEANAAGIPIIGYNKGNISDYIKHGVNGYLFEDMNEIHNYMEFCETRDMSVDCYKAASYYDLEKVLPLYQKLYSEVFAGENYFLLKQ